MKSIIFLCLFATSFLSYSQSNTVKLTRAYISLKEYKKKYNKPLTANDSLNFLIKNNDTLVLLKDYEKPKGTSVTYIPKDSIFLRHYSYSAFRLKDIDSLDKQQKMYYWKQPIKIYFAENISKSVKKDFLKFANDISNPIDSLSIQKVNKIEDSNFVIFSNEDYNFEPRIKENGTDYYISWNGNNQIYKGAVKINKTLFFNDILFLNALKEYFLRSLGHFNLSKYLDCNSYFSNCYSKDKTFSSMDKELLKYHYSYGICKGTDYETFMNQHKRAKEVLEKTGRKMNFIHPY